MEAKTQPWNPNAELTPRPAPPAAQHAVTRVRIRLWDLPTRLFHWSLVLVMVVAVVTGEIGGDWMRVHGIAGLAVTGLVAFRLSWGVIGATHARFVHFVPTPKAVVAYLKGRWRGIGHNPLGALSVLLLLALLGVQAVTGLFSNDDIAYTGPLVSHVSSDISEWLTGWHRQLATVMFYAVGLHVLAIVFYAVFKKDNLVKPMITGFKEVERGEPTSRGGWVAFFVSVAFGAGAVLLADDVFTSPPAAVAAPTVKPVAPAW